MFISRTILILALLGSTAYAQERYDRPKGSLKTSDVGVDEAGVCWLRGPANQMKKCGPTGEHMAVTATTVLPRAGHWLIIPNTGNPTLVNANGTSTAAGAAGRAHFVEMP